MNVVFDNGLIALLVGGIVSIIVAAIQQLATRGRDKRSDIDRAISERDKAFERAEQLAHELDAARRGERLAQEHMSMLRRQLADAGLTPKPIADQQQQK